MERAELKGREILETLRASMAYWVILCWMRMRKLTNYSVFQSIQYTLILGLSTTSLEL